MINRKFWTKVSAKWSTKTDGVEIPDIRPIEDDLGLDIEDASEELDDILADLDI